MFTGPQREPRVLFSCTRLGRGWTQTRTELLRSQELPAADADIVVEPAERTGLSSFEERRAEVRRTISLSCALTPCSNNKQRGDHTLIAATFMACQEVTGQCSRGRFALP